MAASYGRYEVRGEIGHGGMGAVFRAWDPRFRRDVAVKVLSRQLLSDSDSRTRFDREARAAASLEHFAIVPVYDYGEEAGEPYLVFRLMTGGNLAERISSGPLPLDGVAPMVRRIAAALDYAHSHGTIHRDVKPANILFDDQGEAWLGDFGIARIAEHTSSLTGLGVIGSPHYMSPEQVDGNPAVFASDIYSLGATVYEALAGRPPFEAEHPLAVMLKHVRDQATPLDLLRPDLPRSVAEAVTRCMAKDPAARFASGSAFAAALAPGGDVGTTPWVAPVPFATSGTVLPARPPTEMPRPPATPPSPRLSPPVAEAATRLHSQATGPGVAPRAAAAGGAARVWLAASGGVALLAMVAVAVVLARGGGGGDNPVRPDAPRSATVPPSATAAAAATPARDATPSPPPTVQKQFARADQVINPPKNTYTATIKTSKGDIVLKLNADAAPNTVNSFVFLAKNGFYDNIKFHRVVPDFVVQGGDPTGSGSGGPGYQTNDEPNDLSNKRGTMSMAKTAGATSFGSQWFINLKDNPGLDKSGGARDAFYPFAEVTSGMDVVLKIAQGDIIQTIVIDEKPR